MSTSTSVGRIAAILALIGALVIVVLLLFGGGDSYKVTADFENASQLVNGNTVAVAGVSVGKVDEIKLADDGHAEVVMSINDADYEPLQEGTVATVRSQSLSGVANRYVELTMPPADKAGGDIESGGAIDLTHTVSEVDLDAVLNTLDEKTIGECTDTGGERKCRGLRGVINGFARSYTGVGQQANEGFYYLNPLLSTSRRVFAELNSDQPALESLIVNGASLTSALAARSSDIDHLVDGGSKALGAIGRQNQRLATAIGELPRLHAPVQYDLVQPPGRARRRRSADQGLAAGGQGAEAVRREPPRLRPRRRARGQGPRQDRRQAGSRQ